MILLGAIRAGAGDPGSAAEEAGAVADATSLRGRVMCGDQGWFRCPGDPAGRGWVHWSRASKRIAPRTLTFEMWPDLAEFAPSERFPAPGFTDPDGSPAKLFSFDNAATVLRPAGRPGRGPLPVAPARGPGCSAARSRRPPRSRSAPERASPET